jgi:hypothetical protein
MRSRVLLGAACPLIAACYLPDMAEYRPVISLFRCTCIFRASVWNEKLFHENLRRRRAILLVISLLAGKLRETGHGGNSASGVRAMRPEHAFGATPSVKGASGDEAAATKAPEP